MELTKAFEQALGVVEDRQLTEAYNEEVHEDTTEHVQESE